MAPADHVVIPSTKFEDAMAVSSWVMSSDISHRISLTMHLQPLRMRRVTWHMCIGQIFLTYLKSLILMCLFTIHTTCMALRLRQIELSAKTVWPCVKDRIAHAQNHISLARCRKYFTTIVLGDRDFPWIASNFGNLAAIRAIFSYIFTVHAQKRLFMNFQLKLWHHHSIPWPRFPYRERNFGDLRTFSVDFCIG